MCALVAVCLYHKENKYICSHKDNKHKVVTVFLVIIIIVLDKCILIKIVLSLALRNDLWVFPSFKLNNCYGKFVKLYVVFVVQCKKQCIAHHGGSLQK